jgi:hypothetical protein
MKLNPNHPVNRGLDNQWHKIAALIMKKLGVNHVVITEQDIDSMQQGMFIAVQERHDGLHVCFVDEATAHRLVRENGGLPS